MGISGIDMTFQAFK